MSRELNTNDGFELRGSPEKGSIQKSIGEISEDTSKLIEETKGSSCPHGAMFVKSGQDKCPYCLKDMNEREIND